MTKDTEWIQVGELAKGYIGGHKLPGTEDLVGKSLRIYFENGTTTQMRFNDETSLSWEMIEGSDKGMMDTETYRATSPRPNIYLVDYVKHSERALSVSLVLDLEKNIATAVLGRMPTEEETRKDLFSRVNQGMELTPVNVTFLSATLDCPFKKDEKTHSQTNDLVGKRVKWVYSQSEIYEHIYLNENLYTWHCLAGSEKGLADTDRCRYIKIDDSLYLFIWWEKIIPTLGVVLTDHRDMRSTGKIFGYESNDFHKLTNASVGAHGTLLNITK